MVPRIILFLLLLLIPIEEMPAKSAQKKVKVYGNTPHGWYMDGVIPVHLILDDETNHFEYEEPYFLLKGSYILSNDTLRLKPEVYTIWKGDSTFCSLVMQDVEKFREFDIPETFLVSRKKLLDLTERSPIFFDGIPLPIVRLDLDLIKKWSDSLRLTPPKKRKNN